MQIVLILGILVAIGAVVFAMQNTVAVTVTLAVWQFEGSLAVVLLVALGIGVLITGLLSSPSVIRRQWATSRLRRQVADLERELANEQKRNRECAAELARLSPKVGPGGSEDDKSYVGLRTLLSGEEGGKAPSE